MSYINVKQAINIIQKETKQRCNEFTLLHYIANNQIDIFIDNEIHGFHICRVGLHGYECDDDWVAYSIDTNYKGALKLSTEENEVSTRIIALNESMDVIEVYKAHSDLQYVLLASKLDTNTDEAIKALAYSSGDIIELPYINQELGIGRPISKDDLLFDERQIESLGLKPIIQEFSNTHKRNLATRINKTVGTEICGHIHAIDINKPLTNVRVAEIASSIFETLGIKIEIETITNRWNWKNKNAKKNKK